MREMALTQAIKGSLLETFVLSVLGVSTSRLFPDHGEPFLGYWRYPLIVMGIFLFSFFLRYLPNAKAHDELVRSLGDEYLRLLDEKLEKHSMISLMRDGWFKKRLEQYESEKPTFIENMRRNIGDSDRR